MGNKTRGLYYKFDVQRTDGQSEPGRKHAGCFYFVLDVDHDKHALPALHAYAVSCKEEYPLLSRDVSLIARQQRRKYPDDDLIPGLDALIERLSGVVADYERGVDNPLLHHTARGLIEEVRNMGLNVRCTFTG
jgi:hypothetical protein